MLPAALSVAGCNSSNAYTPTDASMKLASSKCLPMQLQLRSRQPGPDVVLYLLPTGCSGEGLGHLLCLGQCLMCTHEQPAHAGVHKGWHGERQDAAGTRRGGQQAWAPLAYATGNARHCSEWQVGCEGVAFAAAQQPEGVGVCTCLLRMRMHLTTSTWKPVADARACWRSFAGMWLLSKRCSVICCVDLRINSIN